VLIGAGVVLVVHSVLIAVAELLWFTGVITFASGPPRFEPAMFPAYLVGSFVAFRTARARGVAVVTLLLALSVAGFLVRAWPSAGGLGPGGSSPLGLDLDFVIPHAWGAAAIVLGTAAARWWPAGAVSSPALTAAGSYAVILSLIGFLSTFSPSLCPTPSDARPCIETENVVSTVLMSVGAFVSAVKLARRDVGPSVLVAICLALPATVTLAFQGSMVVRDGPLLLLGLASSIIAAALFVVGAALPHRSTTSRRTSPTSA